MKKLTNVIQKLPKGKVESLTAKTSPKASKLFPYHYNYYKTDGTIEVIRALAPLPLKQLQDLVGGSIEGVSLRNGNYLFVNEEGWINDLPRNPHFTEADVFVDLSHSDGKLCGNVIEGKLQDEDFVGFTEEETK